MSSWLKGSLVEAVAESYKARVELKRRRGIVDGGENRRVEGEYMGRIVDGR